MSDIKNQCTNCEELLCEIDYLVRKNAKLNDDCRKYRVALNRIAKPETWGINPGFHTEIAKRALVIGVNVDPLPDGAKITV